MRGGKPEKFKITPAIDAMIRKAYAEQVGMESCTLGNHPVRDLANRLGFPRWKITRRAQVLGLITKGKKEPDWSPEELNILEHQAHKNPEVIQKHLRRAGFHRSVYGIVVKRKRMRFLRNLKGQSATDLAECFGVDVKVITRWIRLGYLKAGRRGTGRLESQGGDMYWIKGKDIKEFVINYLEEIDFRKVDKFWMVDLLTGKSAEY
ncbi:MAG: hypothetical protein AB1611_03345 [bacterium]